MTVKGMENTNFHSIHQNHEGGNYFLTYDVPFISGLNHFFFRDFLSRIGHRIIDLYVLKEAQNEKLAKPEEMSLLVCVLSFPHHTPL